MQESIYIIGGKYRKKKITFPNTPNLRPTSNRIRETLFNWLMHDIRGAECLDAYAGSGALGLEAISRGAQSVTLIESNDLVYTALKKTIASFGNKDIQICKSDIEMYLKTTSKVFDIVFIDPPFSEPFPYQCINFLINHSRLSPNGFMYVEYNKSLELDPKLWEIIKTKRAGQVYYALCKPKFDN